MFLPCVQCKLPTNPWLLCNIFYIALKIEQQVSIISLAWSVCVCRYMAMQSQLAIIMIGEFYIYQIPGDRNYQLSMGCWAPKVLVEEDIEQQKAAANEGMV